MKQNIFSILFITLFAIACNKEKLNPIPQTSLSDAVAFSDSSRSVQQVFGLYSALKAGQMYAGRYQVYQDIRGEEFLNQTNNGITAWQTWQFNVNANTNEILNFWSAAYTCINRCNVVIAGLATSPVSDGLKKSLIAEAKLVRALSYFMLQQLYAQPYANQNGASKGVLLKLTPQTSSGENEQARATTAEIYTQILKDLNEAEVDLPLTYGAASVNTTRAHKNTAIALKTRVYLNMGQWSEVIREANKIVPVSTNALPISQWQSSTGVSNGLNASMTNVFTNYSSIEAIFSMPFTSVNVPGQQNGLGSYYNPGPVGNGDFSLNTTGNGIAANTDWRSSDARRSFHTTVGSITYLRKFPNPNNAADWAPVVRYAEVMLNLSEALAMNASGTSVDQRALAILNAIRLRSDPTMTPFNPASKDELIDLILTERRIELLGEGLRTSDITRRRLPFPAKGVINAVAPTANEYIWPIPNSELLINKKCEQNPGY